MTKKKVFKTPIPTLSNNKSAMSGDASGLDVESDEFGTANSGVEFDPEQDVDPTLKTRLNVILVGTKLDLVKKNENAR